MELPLRQIFNERSLTGCSSIRGFSDFLLFDFLKVVGCLRDAGFASELALSRKVTDQVDDDGKWLFKWLFAHGDEGDARERKNVLRGLFSRGLCLEDIVSPDSIDDVYLGDERISGSDYVPALVASYYLRMPSVSVRAEAGHEDGRYRLKIVTAEGQGGQIRLTTTEDTVKSISNERQIPGALDEIRSASIRELAARDDLKDVVPRVFPRLAFSAGALRTLSDVCVRSARDAFFWFCRMLFEIDYAWSRVQTGECGDFFTAFGDVGYVARSETPLTQRTYREEHTFQDADGNCHVCFSHCRNKPLNKRVYFNVPDNHRDKVFVGHIGGHLVTVRY